MKSNQLVTIQNGDQLVACLRSLSRAYRLAFIRALGDVKLRGIIQNTNELSMCLYSLPRADRLAFIRALGDVKLREIIQNANELNMCLYLLSGAADKDAFKSMLGEVKLREIIQNNHQLSTHLPPIADEDEEAARLLMALSNNSRGIQQGGQFSEKSSGMFSAASRGTKRPSEGTEEEPAQKKPRKK